MNWEYPPKEMLEQLDVLRFVAAKSNKKFSCLPGMVLKEVDKDFDRIINMLRLGRELRPGSYKHLAVTHKGHGTDAWEVHIAAGIGSKFILNSENYNKFRQWMNSPSYYEHRPCSEHGLKRKYPHIRIG